MRRGSLAVQSGCRRRRGSRLCVWVPLPAWPRKPIGKCKVELAAAPARPGRSLCSTKVQLTVQSDLLTLQRALKRMRRAEAPQQVGDSIGRPKALALVSRRCRLSELTNSRAFAKRSAGSPGHCLPLAALASRAPGPRPAEDPADLKGTTKRPCAGC